MTRGRWLLSLAGASVLLTACTGGSRGVRLEHLTDLTDPTAMAARRGDAALYVGEQAGTVVAFRRGEKERVLDLRREVEAGGERGLLGLAFSVDGKRLYVSYTGHDDHLHLVEYAFAHGRASPASARELLRIRHPAPNHFGGQLAFGPDRMLYLSTGDGGVRGRTSQSLRSLLGKLLRIDPRPTGGAPYTVPADNPMRGTPGARAEIWAYGLRNPWRFSFDRATGDLWIGDVGEGRFEEINLVLRGRRGPALNFGWNAFEGTSRRGRSELDPTSSTDPLVELPHTTGDCSVIGGFVYRGSRLPDLVGAYLFTDYCNGEIRWVRQEDGAVTSRGRLDLSVELVTSFGEDVHGELYVLSREEGLLRLVPD